MADRPDSCGRHFHNRIKWHPGSVAVWRTDSRSKRRIEYRINVVPHRHDGAREAGLPRIPDGPGGFGSSGHAAQHCFDRGKTMDGNRAGKLLLVEDEHVLRGLIAHFLRCEGFEVVEAADGSQGVSYFSALGPFDVVLLDLNLPLLPGVEVCRHIKSEQPSQPVIICSAAILESHIAMLRELHVEEYLSKPYHPLDLLRRIAAEMARGRSSESIDAVRPSRTPIWRESPGHSPLASTHTLVKAPILD
jgi:CheY-like chemotaxis protein